MFKFLKSKFLLSIMVVGVVFFVFAFTTTARADCAITSTLRLGSKGPQVACLQTSLGLTADGNFGPQTKSAVITFQQNNGLLADGVVGPKTISAFSLNKQSQGPVGPTGPQGPIGPQGPAGPTGFSSGGGVSIIQPNPITNYSGGSLFSATDLSSTNFITSTAKIATLDVSGNSTLTGGLSVAGASTLNSLNVSGTSNLTGNLAIDTNTLFVDSVNHRVGIGTTAPTESLSIKGSGDLKIGITNTSPTGVSGPFAFNDTGRYTGFQITGSGSVGNWMTGVPGANLGKLVTNADTFVVGTQSVAPIVIITNNIERMRISATGNVGIGTTNPSQPLIVVGSGGNGIKIQTPANGTANFFFGTASTNYGTLFYDDATGEMTLGSLAAYGMNFEVNGAVKMKLTSGGNVGIGTTLPDNKLDIRGAAATPTTPNQGTNTGGIFSIADAGRNTLDIGYLGGNNGFWLQGGRDAS